MKPAIKLKLKELLEFAKNNDLKELAWQEEGMKISFRRGAVVKGNSPPAEIKPPEIQKSKEDIVRSPIVGTFRRSKSKSHPPIVVEGNHIRPGDRLAIVECMKIPNDVVSFCAGQISKLLVEDGQKVEYGQPLFAVLLNKSNGSNGRHV